MSRTATVLALSLFCLGYMAYYFSNRTRVFKTLAARLGGGAGGIAGGGVGAAEGIADAGMRPAGMDAQEAGVYLEKTLGFVFIGLLPYIAARAAGLTAAQAGLAWPAGPWAGRWWLGVVGFFLLLTAIRPRAKINVAFYPQVRAERWDLGRVVRNSSFWILYLLGYELAFRGFLLFPLAAAMGAPLAVAINSALYAFAHIYKGPGEAFGAFFLGVALCAVALATGSFAIPFVAHVILALGNDYSAVAAHPDMGFGPRGR